MSIRSNHANHNLVAVSAGYRETGINVWQTLDTTLAVDIGDIIDLDPRRKTNANEATGLEEADQIYDLGNTASTKFNFKMAQPHQIAFLLSYFFGVCSTTAAGIGYLHTITPIAGDLESNRSNPSFPAMQRLGKTIMKRKFYSMFVDSFTMSFKKDDFVTISGDIKGTGKYVSNVTEETLSAPGNAASITLAANGVQGADAAGRLENVQRIRAELAAGIWTEVSFSAISAATPAVITITPPGGSATPVNYKVLYLPTEDTSWTFPARLQESPLRVAELQVNVGGTWNGTTFQGGRLISPDINAVDWKGSNKLKIEFVPGAGGAYASSCIRSGREQTLSLDRKMREAILQQHMISNEQFGARLLVEGMNYDAGNTYQAEVIFPKLAVMKAPVKVADKIIGETGDLQVLEDATYGSVIIRIKNLQPRYAQ